MYFPAWDFRYYLLLKSKYLHYFPDKQLPNNMQQKVFILQSVNIQVQKQFPVLDNLWTFVIYLTSVNVNRSSAVWPKYLLSVYSWQAVTAVIAVKDGRPPPACLSVCWNQNIQSSEMISKEIRRLTPDNNCIGISALI